MSDALRCCLRPANFSDDSSSLALLASGVSTKPTKNAGMPLACISRIPAALLQPV